MEPKPKNEAAAALGRIKSDKKTAAARANGALGGRPPMEIVRIEEVAYASQRSYSQLWRRADGKWCHIIFQVPEAQSLCGNYYALGNTESAIRACARWTTEAAARESHQTLLASRV